jgi:V/A-type H+-transporting ATPase subunit I
MDRVRILGRRERLEPVLACLQDFGLVHLSAPEPVERLRPVSLTARDARHVRAFRAALEDVERALARLGSAAPSQRLPLAEGVDRVQQVRHARRSRRKLEAMAAQQALYEEQHERLRGFRELFGALGPLGAGAPASAQVFHLIVRGDPELVRLRNALAEALGETFQLEQAPLASGEIAVALVTPRALADRVEALLRRSEIRELPLPDAAELGSLAAIEARLREVEAHLARLELRRREMAFELAPLLHASSASFHDALAATEALGAAAETPRAFVLEGWLPVSALPALEEHLREQEGERVAVETVATEAWHADDAPVVLSNPRIFRPFEAITRLMPLPRYGSIDPTPFVAVFFPVFFGMILGDVGYGAVLGLVALLVLRRAGERPLLQTVARIAGACAVFSLAFGLLYGELFGDVGSRWLGMRPLAFSRERALVPFLGLAVALGFIHVLIGLVLGAIATLRQDPRRSVGRGLAALMTVLVALALLAALNVLPGRFFTPAVVALLVVFPVFVAIEGVIGPIELLSTLSNVLSYVRIMALGTASVMLAVVANELVGAVGGVFVGAILALLFHLVNFVLGVFSPTIHALRLHYVEFFGKFYSPGGLAYRPFGHWRPGEAESH